MDISIVIPYHNEGDLLLRSVASVQSQEFDGTAEIIVVDDCSEIPPPVLPKGRFPVRLIRLEAPSYAGAARNAGVAAARGRYTCFLDADDEYLPERFSSHMAILHRRPDIAVVFGPHEMISDGVSELHSHYMSRFHPAEVNRVFRLPEDVRFNACWKIPFTVAAMTFPRSLFLRLGGFKAEYRWGEEWEFEVRLVGAGAVWYCPRPTFRYIRRAYGSICSTANYRKQVSAAEIAGLLRKTPGLPREIRRHLRSTEHAEWLLAAQTCLEQGGCPTESLKLVRKALRSGFSFWALKSVAKYSGMVLATRNADSREGG